jgi:hypothetical protein
VLIPLKKQLIGEKLTPYGFKGHLLAILGH